LIFSAMFSIKQFLKPLLAIAAAISITACGDGGSGPDPNTVTTIQPKKPTVILIFGDSTSQGYGVEKFGEYYEDVPPGLMYADLLRNRLKAEKIDKFAPVTVINESLGSEFAFEAIGRLAYVLAVHQPTHVLLAHGTNDARAAFPLSSISDTFITMINMVRGSGAKPMLADMTLTVRGTGYANEYSQMIKQTAYIGAATYVPIVEDIIFNPKYVLNDGFGYHYNVTAQPFMMNNVWKKLMPLLE
jgi:acyl-CoA thioesterase I